jgi:putative acetyltransferase
VEGLTLRLEGAADAARIRRVNQLAFGRDTEADLVDALRASGAARLSIAAERGGELVGHILFSPVSIAREDGSVDPAVGLGPLAVIPALQRQGVGAALIRAGAATLEHAGDDAIVVLGHPGYYARFGFIPARRFGLRCEFEAPEEAFMVRELRPGSLGQRAGVVHYHAEFGRVA